MCNHIGILDLRERKRASAQERQKNEETTKKGYQTILHSMRDLRPFHLLLFIYLYFFSVVCSVFYFFFFFFSFCYFLICSLFLNFTRVRINFQFTCTASLWSAKLRGKLCVVWSKAAAGWCWLFVCWTWTRSTINILHRISKTDSREEKKVVCAIDATLYTTISILMSLVRIRQFILWCVVSFRKFFYLIHSNSRFVHPAFVIIIVNSHYVNSLE